jgi:hypothetical protein
MPKKPYKSMEALSKKEVFTDIRGGVFLREIDPLPFRYSDCKVKGFFP